MTHPLVEMSGTRSGGSGTIVGVGVAGIGVGTAYGLGAFDGGSGGASFTGTVQLP